MVRKALHLLVIVLIFSSCGSGNKLTEQKESSSYLDIQQSVEAFEVDKLNNIYILNKDNKVIKYSENYEKLYEYSNKQVGNISRIDVRDPLRIMLFVDDFDRILILDNTLAEIGNIELQDAGFNDVLSACRSNDNSIWIYERSKRKLFRIDENGTTLSESTQMEDFGIEGLSPLKMREMGNSLIIADDNFGFYVFDNFGEYDKKYEVSEIVDFQFDGRLLSFFDGKSVKMYNIRMPNPSTLGFPPQLRRTRMKNIYYTKNKWYGVNEDGVLAMDRE